MLRNVFPSEMLKNKSDLKISKLCFSDFKVVNTLWYATLQYKSLCLISCTDMKALNCGVSAGFLSVKYKPELVPLLSDTPPFHLDGPIGVEDGWPQALPL